MHCPRHAAAVPHFCTVTLAISLASFLPLRIAKTTRTLHACPLVLHLIPKRAAYVPGRSPFKCPPLWRGPASWLLSVCRIHRQKPTQFRQKQCRIMSIFAMTKKCYLQIKIQTHILICIKMYIKTKAREAFILIRIKIHITINIKIRIRVIIFILMRIIINVKIKLDTMR